MPPPSSSSSSARLKGIKCRNGKAKVWSQALTAWQVEKTPDEEKAWLAAVADAQGVKASTVVLRVLDALDHGEVVEVARLHNARPCLEQWAVARAEA